MDDNQGLLESLVESMRRLVATARIDQELQRLDERITRLEEQLAGDGR